MHQFVEASGGDFERGVITYGGIGTNARRLFRGEEDDAFRVHDQCGLEHEPGEDE